MTRWKRSVLLAVVVSAALLASASTVQAVILMVNGTTPSVRFARWTAQFARRMPVPSGTIDLYLKLPMSCGVLAPGQFSGCSMSSVGRPDGRPAIYLDAVHLRGGDLRDTLAHEEGHLLLDIADDVLTDTDRSRFVTIWRRPRLDWWVPLNPSCAESDVACGEPSAAGEWAAEAYRLCATGEWRGSEAFAALGYLPDQGIGRVTSGGQVLSNNDRAMVAPVVASCGLFRAAAARSQNR